MMHLSNINVVCPNQGRISCPHVSIFNLRLNSLAGYCYTFIILDNDAI